jgi:hypothetical protein
MTYTVHVRKDSATVVPVSKETLDEALEFCLDRDVVSVTDADGRSVAYGPSQDSVEAERIEGERQDAEPE